MTTLLQEAITQVALLPEDDQNRAAEVLLALARHTALPPEDDATRAAIAEGVAQAKSGRFASASDVDALLATVWR